MKRPDKLSGVGALPGPADGEVTPAEGVRSSGAASGPGGGKEQSPTPHTETL